MLTNAHDPSSFSRRSLLAALLAGGCGGLFPSLRLSSAAEAVSPPDRLRQDGGLVRLPGRGTLLIASDFHTRHADFRRWLSTTRLVDKLKDNEDVYGLILGDAVDAKPRDPEAEENGDSRIVDEIREIQTKLGGAGNRLIYLLGNHEFQVLSIYEELQARFGMTPKTRADLVAKLYASENGDYFRQWNFIERITEEQFKYLKQRPVAVLAGNRVLAVHAGASKKARTIDDIVERRHEVVQELVWSRPRGAYEPEDLLEFLKRMESTLLITGHTPLSSLPPDWIKNGIGTFADLQVILATSYGSAPGEKSYLSLDLARPYTRIADLRPGEEIRKLADQVGLAAPAYLAVACTCPSFPNYPRHSHPIAVFFRA